MAYIFALSDIHGYLDIFKETLKNVDLQTIDNKLILLGDYISRGDKSCETLYFVKELSEKYPNQVIVLRGNHEEMFLEQLSDRNYILYADNYNEIQNYLSQEELNSITNKYNDSLLMSANIIKIYSEMIDLIKTKHKALVAWLKSLPYYFETDSQIFVHAGIDEEAGEDWKWGTEDYCFCFKYPHTIGKFHKDIISGHIGTCTVANDENYHRVFWDKQSHIYIDGTTEISKIIPVLKFDTDTKRYSSFEKIMKDNTNFIWQEYAVK